MLHDLEVDVAIETSHISRSTDEGIGIEQIRALLRDGQHFFCAHALTEAKKDGVSPEDVVHVILTGEVIETYPERQRLLIYGVMMNGLPLHVVCDTSAGDLVIIPTVYIPDDSLWVGYRRRR